MIGSLLALLVTGTAPCVPVPHSPPCVVWSGRVHHVSDGDTLSVDLDGDATSRPVRVRVSGIQAMEQQVYSRLPWRRRGQCHALPATAALEQLVRAGGGRVRLSAQSPASVSRGRPRRHVSVRIGGVWRDAGLILLREGHALWLPDRVENAWNRYYNAAAQRAAAAGRNLWNPRACGAGPAAAARLSLSVTWDADGRDAWNPNGEQVSITNRGGSVLALAGWWVRDSGLRRYTFPRGVRVFPGGTVLLHSGRGRNSGADLYWGLPGPVFDNARGAPAELGDGGYLFDPGGDLRAAMTYPCSYACRSPLIGRLRLRVHPRGREYLSVTNTSRWDLDLAGYAVVAGSRTYAFPPATLLPRGGALRLFTGTGAGTATARYWGLRRPILSDRSGMLTLRTPRGIALGCRSWGHARCR